MNRLNRNLSTKITIPLWVLMIAEFGCTMLSLAVIGSAFNMSADFAHMLTLWGFMVVVTVINLLILLAPRVKENETLDKTNN